MLPQYISSCSEEIFEYILFLHNMKKNKKMNQKKIDFLVLQEFILNKECNIYKCHKSLMNKSKYNQNYSPTYKTVHTKVHELSAWGLIERDQGSSLDHGAIEYHLSPLGVFQVIKDYHSELKDLSLLIINRNDKLFQAFLYPFISMQTLVNLKDQYITCSIFDYLSKICKAIDKCLDQLKEIEYNGGVNNYVTNTFELDSILGFGNRDKMKPIDLSSTDFFRYLESKHGIRWKDMGSVRIVRQDGGTIYNIGNDEREVIYEINRSDEHDALLWEDENILIEFNYSNWTEDLPDYEEVYEFIPISVEDYLMKLMLDRSHDSYIFRETDIPINELCWRIINHLCSKVDDYLSKINKTKLSIFANDPMFVKCVQEVEKDREAKIYQFNQLSKLQGSN